MRISAKGRYALAAMISMAENHESGEYITVISISEKLGISKSFGTGFSLLKEADRKLVKGAQGGYSLPTARQISVLDVLSRPSSFRFSSPRKRRSRAKPRKSKRPCVSPRSTRWRAR
jgi:DNA-binding IscR family transcriptional regulator